MIFIRKQIKFGAKRWKRKFAFLPKTFVDSNKDIKVTVWLGFYEEKVFWQSSCWVTCYEYRLIDKKKGGHAYES